MAQCTTYVENETYKVTYNNCYLNGSIKSGCLIKDFVESKYCSGYNTYFKISIFSTHAKYNQLLTDITNRDIPYAVAPDTSKGVSALYLINFFKSYGYDCKIENEYITLQY